MTISLNPFDVFASKIAVFSGKKNNVMLNFLVWKRFIWSLSAISGYFVVKQYQFSTNRAHYRYNYIYLFFIITAQHNPIIRENQSVKLCHTPTQAFPSLLELSARAIIHTRITTWKEEGAIPLHLVGKIICSKCSP